MAPFYLSFVAPFYMSFVAPLVVACCSGSCSGICRRLWLRWLLLLLVAPGSLQYLLSLVAPAVAPVSPVAPVAPFNIACGSSICRSWLYSTLLVALVSVVRGSSIAGFVFMAPLV